MAKLNEAELRRQVEALPWFHSIDFGNGIVAKGHKPAALLNSEADQYFSSISLKGRSFLDIGAWSGFFSFEAKRRGAERVLATDKFAWTKEINGRAGFDLAREHFGLDVEAAEIDVPDLSVEQIGRFDVVLFAGVFYHLFEAPKLLKQVCDLAAHAVIVETHQDLLDLNRPAMVYYPGSDLDNDPTNFWGPNPLLMTQLLSESGFSEIHFMPNPNSTGRGIYLAFRDSDSAALLRFDNSSGAWQASPSASPMPLEAVPPQPSHYGAIAPRTFRNAVNFLLKRPLT